VMTIFVCHVCEQFCAAFYREMWAAETLELFRSRTHTHYRTACVCVCVPVAHASTQIYIKEQHYNHSKQQ